MCTVRSSRQRPPQPEARGETLTPSTYGGDPDPGQRRQKRAQGSTQKASEHSIQDLISRRIHVARKNDEQCDADLCRRTTSGTCPPLAQLTVTLLVIHDHLHSVTCPPRIPLSSQTTTACDAWFLLQWQLELYGYEGQRCTGAAVLHR